MQQVVKKEARLLMLDVNIWALLQRRGFGFG